MKPSQAHVLLTGATGGIGQAIARALHQAGANLLLSGRSPARLAALASELHDPARPQAVHWHAADLGDAQALAGLVQQAERCQVNVLVNNAGLPSFGRLTELAPSELQQVIATNLLAPMLLTQALLPQLLRQPQARVIQIGSALGRIGLPGFSVYSASKFGLRGFSEALRRELAGSTLKVQYLGPRSTDTGFNNDELLASNQATGTAMDHPDVVAQALLALLQSKAAERFIGFPEVLAVRLNGLAPSWLDGSFAKHRQQLPARPASAERAPLAPPLAAPGAQAPSH